MGSESDSDVGEEWRGGGVTSMFPGGILHTNSMEVSLWSLDISMPSGMETSVYETEVKMMGSSAADRRCG